MSLIVITGATRGLGAAMAREFLARGHAVAGCGRHVRQGAGFRLDSVDVSDDAAVQQWASAILGDLGTPDFLVNNAAVINRNAPLWKVPAGEFSQVIDVNIKGVANVIRHFVPAMIRRRKGVIVNFSSGWGRSVDAEVAPYCATKWAIEGLTQALALELPEGMAAVPLNPGVINTEMLQSCFGGNASGFPGPDDWAKRAAPFILGLDAKDNGQPLSVS